jgi:hypothetical protein
VRQKTSPPRSTKEPGQPNCANFAMCLFEPPGLLTAGAELVPDRDIPRRSAQRLVSRSTPTCA